MDRETLINMMRHQSDALRVMGSSLLDFSSEDGDEWAIHGHEAFGAAIRLSQWADTLEGIE